MFAADGSGEPPMPALTFTSTGDGRQHSYGTVAQDLGALTGIVPTTWCFWPMRVPLTGDHVYGSRIAL